MAENPYVRLRYLCGISQKEFAEKYGFSKTTMTYLESGQYPDLSEKMILSLGQECSEKGIPAKQLLATEFSASNLQDAYHQWQRKERFRSRAVFLIEPPERWNKELSPMHFYVKATTGSVQKFCKLLKVPSASVMRYTTGTTRQMPKALEEAFRQIDFTHLKELLEMQAAWVDENV